MDETAPDESDEGPLGFPRFKPPLPAKNDNPQLHFEGVNDRLRTVLHQMHGDLGRQQLLDADQAVVLQCLLQLLLGKGMVTREELDALYPSMQAGVQAMRSNFLTGPRSSGTPDPIVEPKDLDCSAHHAICGAVCCTSFNVFLTAEEAASGKYLWDVAVPYRLLVDDAGTCVYFDHEGQSCSIWKDRPLACRTFDCRADGRLWENYPTRTLSLMSLESKARQAALRQRERAAAADTEKKATT